MAKKILLRGDTKANWLSVDPVLSEREAVIETDGNLFKIGDGVKKYSELPYVNQGEPLGGIEFDSTVPEPGRSGKYIFTTSGSCTWLTGGAQSVNISDEVLVIYDSTLETYTYTLLSNTSNFVEKSNVYNGLDKTVEGFALDSRQGKALDDVDKANYSKSVEMIAHDATAPSPVIPTGTTKTYEFSSGGVCAWLANQVVEKGDKATVAFTAPSTYVRTYQDVVTRKAKIVSEKYGNNVWATYGSETTLDNLFSGTATRRMVYSSIRWAQFVGCDSTVPRTIRMVWNGYVDYFRLIVSAYNTTLSAWEDEFDTGNLSLASVNPAHSAVIPITITKSDGKIAKFIVDTSILTYPFVSGSEFNTLASTPEWVFSQSCYEISDLIGLPYRSKQNVRLYPNTPISCVSFQFDDNHANDEQVVALFDEYGVKCNFAFVASTANVSSYCAKYLDYQRKGYGICSHSIDSVIFNTANYNAATALAALQTSKNRLENAGFIINGFVSPSSQMDASFIDSVKKTYAYAFTYNDAGNIGRTSNPCTIIRESLESKTIAQTKAWLDDYIAADKCCTLYGHAASFGTVNGTSGEMWDIAKLREILEYVIAKRDAGLAFLGNTDECVKYFFYT